MKLLTAFVTTVALLGFGAAAFAACPDMEARKQQQIADQSAPPYIPPSKG
jgi:hypothetical protein